MQVLIDAGMTTGWQGRYNKVWLHIAAHLSVSIMTMRIYGK